MDQRGFVSPIKHIFCFATKFYIFVLFPQKIHLITEETESFCLLVLVEGYVKQNG